MFADVAVVAQTPAYGCLTELEVGSKPPAVEQGTSQSRAKGEEKFEAAAGDHAGPVDLGVVEHEARDLEALREGVLHVEPRPGLHQLGQDLGAGPRTRDVVRRGHHNAVPDHARHSHRDAIGVGELRRELCHGLHQALRWQRVGRGGANRRGPHRAR